MPDPSQNGRGSSDEDAVEISLVICTRNRSASLRNCLDYVRHLESPGSWELIVVDNGSSDGTAAMLSEFAKTAAFPVVLLYESVPGLARARNTGWLRARGSIVAFTDDDCYVSATFLKEITRVFVDRQIGFIGGRVLLHDPEDSPRTTRPDVTPYRIEPHQYICAGQLLGANMAFRRSVLASVGGFDPVLGAGARFCASEDTDLQARASASGIVGAYDPGPMVWHHHGRKPGKETDSLNRNYDFGRGAYFAKFIIDPRTRRLFLKNWYWSTRNNLRDRQFGMIMRELAGALHYVAFRLRWAKG